MPTKKVTTQSASTKKTATPKAAAPAKKPVESTAVSPPASTQKATEPPTAVETPAAAEKPAAAPAVAAKPTADAPSKKTTTATKKTTAKPAPAKAEAAKKTTPKPKAPPAAVTRIVAKVDIGYGNNLYVRGEGAELSWTQGTLMENTAGDEWSWSTQTATEPLTFKFLINDELWSAGDNLTVAPGESSISSPVF